MVIPSFGNTSSLCLSIRVKTASLMDLETNMIHAEIQPVDEITVTDRAIVDHVRGCHMPLDVHASRFLLSINQLLKTERCRSTFRLNFLASCWLLVSPCAMRSPPTYRRGDLAVLTSIYTHQACNKASWLKSRVAIVSILVGLSITAVDT